MWQKTRVRSSARKQGCQMVYFQTKNPNLGTFWRAWKVKCWYILRPWGIFKAIWYNLWPFGIVCDYWVYFSRLGMFGPNLATLPAQGQRSIARKRKRFRFLVAFMKKNLMARPVATGPFSP
jgi:hypothetical protein